MRISLEVSGMNTLKISQLFNGRSFSESGLLDFSQLFWFVNYAMEFLPKLKRGKTPNTDFGLFHFFQTITTFWNGTVTTSDESVEHLKIQEKIISLKSLIVFIGESSYPDRRTGLDEKQDHFDLSQYFKRIKMRRFLPEASNTNGSLVLQLSADVKQQWGQNLQDC